MLTQIKELEWAIGLSSGQRELPTLLFASREDGVGKVVLDPTR